MTDAPKRFYKTASIEQSGDSWTVTLDDRPIKTPAKALLALPTEALARVIAEEWNAQGEVLDLASMTLTKLANVVLDRTPYQREAMAEELSNYAGTDVTCYLADGPTPLRERQDAAWRPWRDWAGEKLGVVLLPVEGLMASPQPQASLDAVKTYAIGLDDFRLTGLSWACALYGSAILALALEHGAISGSDALKASCVDEDWQIENWGEDDEAKAARAARARDAEALQIWFQALST